MQCSNKHILLQLFQIGERNQVRTKDWATSNEQAKKNNNQNVSQITLCCVTGGKLLATLSRPWTNRPVSYLKEESALQSREHFLSAGVRKRQRVRTICYETRVRFQHFDKLNGESFRKYLDVIIYTVSSLLSGGGKQVWDCRYLGTIQDSGWLLD